MSSGCPSRFRVSRSSWPERQHPFVRTYAFHPSAVSTPRVTTYAFSALPSVFRLGPTSPPASGGNESVRAVC